MSVNCSFIALPQIPEVEVRGCDLNIWHGKTANLSALYYPLNNLLNKDEQAAAARYHQQADREGYVIRHGVLRLLLSRRLNMRAADIAFSFNQYSKPYLKSVETTDCFFNISHSAGEFLIAIGSDELGVDIEQMDPAFEWQDIADRYFSATEVAYISTAANPTQAFFLLWTRKEALIKACGMGIDDNLPAVPALDGLHFLPDYYPKKDWQTASFTFGHNFVGCITYPSPARNLKLIQIGESLAQSLL